MLTIHTLCNMRPNFIERNWGNLSAAVMIVGPPPSQNDVRSTCMHILPLVEMYCKWELGEECSDLRSLMLRFDSEVDLNALPNPFDAIRERLAAVDLALGGLHA